VVRVRSTVDHGGDAVDESSPICEFCGLEITEPDQQCAALDNGGCRP
jgi:hypothetical protein